MLLGRSSSIVKGIAASQRERGRQEAPLSEAIFYSTVPSLGAAVRARRAGLVVVAAMAVVAALGCSQQASAPGATSRGEPSRFRTIAIVVEPTPAPRSAWEAVTRKIDANGMVSKQVAVSAFSLAFGRLPGVALPPGARVQIPSGTGAMRWVWGHWGELTPAQHTAVLSHMRRPAVHAMRFASAAVGDRGRGDEVLAALTLAQYQAMVHAARADISLQLHRDIGYDPAVIINEVETFPGQYGPISGDALAYAWSFDASGRPAQCIVWINPTLQAAGVRAEQEAIPHEVFHCFQMALFGSAQAFGTKPPWIVEGQAEWVGCVIAQHCDIGTGWWDLYFTSGLTPLPARSYDALGYYSELNYDGISPWEHLDEMLQAGGNADAYQRAITGNADAFEDDWATSYGRSKYRDPALNARIWDSNGPGITAAMSHPLAFALTNDSDLPTWPIAPYANLFLTPDFEADIIEVSTNSAHARIHFSDGAEFSGTALEGVAFCTLPNGCASPKCPADQFQKAVKGKGYFALSGADTGASFSMRGVSMDEHCNSPSPGSPVQQNPSTTSDALPDACSLLTHGEATAILQLPNSSDSQRQNPTYSSECNYSTARVDPTFAEIGVGVWNHMPGPSRPGGTPCGHKATCYPIHATSAIIQARGGVVVIVVGGRARNTQAMVQQVETYILQKI
jgi:hypothetical protein